MDAFTLENLCESKYEDPVTIDEFHKFLKFKSESTDYLDFVLDVKSYTSLYHEWKSQKKKKKGDKTKDSGLDAATEEDDDSCANSQNNLALASGRVTSSQMSVEGNTKSGRSTAGYAHSETMNDGVRKSSNILDRSLQPTKSAENLRKSGLINSTGSLTPSSSGQKKSSSRDVSNKATAIFKKYLVTGATNPLTFLDKEEVQNIVSHYQNTMETAEKTGLRFVPPPSRAFGTLVKSCIEYYENNDLFDNFISFCISNQIPNNRHSAEYTFMRSYKYFAIEMLAYLLLLIVFILIAALSKGSHLLWLIIILPIFLISLRALLSYNYMNLKLWWYGRRERMVLSSNPLDDIGQPAVTIAREYDIVLEGRILKAQNRRLALYALISISVSLLTAVILTVVTA